jgi:uncharacterized protein YxeA
MKKILSLLAIILFTISASAQETKSTEKETSKKEACCAKHDAMTKEEVATCKAKCKAEGKKCDAKMVKAEGKKCGVKK